MFGEGMKNRLNPTKRDILRKKLERTASFPKKLFLGISPRRLILPPNSLLAAPAGAASKPLLPPTKNHEVQFGARERTRTSTPCGIRTSSVRVYQLHHPGKIYTIFIPIILNALRIFKRFRDKQTISEL